MLLTVPEVAKILKLWPQTIRLWIKKGDLRGYKLPNGEWRIRAEDVDAILIPHAGTHPDR